MQFTLFRALRGQASRSDGNLTRAAIELAKGLAVGSLLLRRLWRPCCWSADLDKLFVISTVTEM